MPDRRLVIWGCGGMGREVKDLADHLKLDTVGFLDERPEWKGRLVEDVPVLGTLGDITYLRDSVQIVCASIGDPALKRRFCN